MQKKHLLLQFVQIILLILLAFFAFAFEDIHTSIYISLLIYIISLIIVNLNKKNLVNLSTFFLLGFGTLIYGRLLAYILMPSIYTIDKIFCLNFFIDTCLSNKEIGHSLMFFSVSLIALCTAYLSKVKQAWNISIPSTSKLKLKFLILILYILTLLKVKLLYSTLLTAITSGYNAIYEFQSEAYESPYSLAVNSLIIAILAVLYSQKERHIFINKHFKLILSIYILASLSGILSGSRASFITGIIIFLWYNLNSKKLPKTLYPLLASLSLLVLSTTNYLASLSGARKFAQDNSLWLSLAKTLFGQGTTFMVADAATKLQDPPILGYIKTLLPGIQILFPMFGVKYRHQFDWGSYLAYSNDPALYNAGFGLGWSVWADFYLLSFSFIPLYVLCVFLWGKYLNTLDTSNTPFVKNLGFILVFFIFSLSRNSLSPLIFTMLIYLITLFFIKSKVKQ